MSFLNDLFIGLDATKRDDLQERLDIVEHKIKFMDKMPVALLDVNNNPSYLLTEEIALAGGMIESDVMNAAFIIYYQPGKMLTDLMREVPSVLDSDWQAVKNNRIILLNDDVNRERSAENAVSLIEDMAEMLHPGSFIFGHEGDKWIRFGA
ncbi:hypothetical protein OQZ33_16315 [Pedobacter sp. MC2016-05]|uniref:hypothetical protein n=1 Tax=unclassified Pedobacter TaxID=2628915 RepID=UPI0007036E69|nr:MULTISPECIES: hypothetical protein [unclassified Pedobacter]KQN38509.1 hypothetical protein ASE92_03505 [Pedobacter sp. Leaf41]MCX2475898.1 hypothetical protein [Pedobacter sp. MC2016-05]